MQKLAHGFYLVAPTTTRRAEGIADAHVKRTIFDERTRWDNSKPRLERVVVAGE